MEFPYSNNSVTLLYTTVTSLVTSASSWLCTISRTKTLLPGSTFPSASHFRAPSTPGSKATHLDNVSSLAAGMAHIILEFAMAAVMVTTASEKRATALDQDGTDVAAA